MRHLFLCPNHRHWLYTHPDSANSALADTQDTALYYRERGQHQQALVYLGNAFETAEIILTTGAQSPSHSVIAFTSCAILLADSYHKLGHSEQCMDVFKTAQKRLQGEYTLHFDDPDTQNCVIACITSLSKGAEMQNIEERQPRMH